MALQNSLTDKSKHMTQEQIIEGNKLIEAFMGEEFGYTDRGYYTVCRYNKSWDWLMPVVEKYVSIAEELEEYGKVDAELYMFITNNIVAVWQSCVSFITWYNQQPK